MDYQFVLCSWCSRVLLFSAYPCNEVFILMEGYSFMTSSGNRYNVFLHLFKTMLVIYYQYQVKRSHHSCSHDAFTLTAYKISDYLQTVSPGASYLHQMAAWRHGWYGSTNWYKLVATCMVFNPGLPKNLGNLDFFQTWNLGLNGPNPGFWVWFSPMFIVNLSPFVSVCE